MTQDVDTALVVDDEITERQKQVLQIVIQEYVKSAQPVGSATIARTARVGRQSRHDPQ